MMLPELHIYPILTAVIFPFTFILTYTIAVLLQHTEFDWPYISDTAAYPPESCIFSQMLNLGALMVGIVVYIRHKQVAEFLLSHQIGIVAIRVNIVGLYLGWIGAFGISIVANFQETAVFKVHLTGALLAFGVGSLYLWTQVYTSFKLTSLTHGRGLTIFRTFLASICSVTFVLMLVAGEISRNQFTGQDPTKWFPGDPGWPLHVCSTISEWIMALAFDTFLLTFFTEFKKVKLDSPKICLRIRQSSMIIAGEECSITEPDLQALAQAEIHT